MSNHQVLSPLPGTFYRKPSPDNPPFKNDGDAVSADDTIGLVEVMKNFQEVKAGADGSSIQFVAEDGAAIMPGDVLAEITG